MNFRKNSLFMVCSTLAVLFATTATQQNTESTPNTEADVDKNTPISEDPQPETTPESEDTPESESNEQRTDSEGHEDWDDSLPEGSQEPINSNPEDNPVVENGFLNLPFNDFDGPVPNDFFIPVDERSEPQETEGEPEYVPEYWWENEPEVFYDDEYAYLNSLAEHGREAEPYRPKGEAEPEYQTEPENEAEPNGNVEPEFEYMSYLKDSEKFGLKKTLKTLIAVLSVLCGSLGAVIVVLCYVGYRQYKEAKLEEIEETTKEDSKTALWEKASHVFQNHLGLGKCQPILTSYKKM